MHPTLGAPASFQKQNALDAQKLNAQFAGLKASDSCTDGQSACVEGSFAQCVGSAWTLKSCGSDLTCFALPLVAKPGTSLTCDTESDAIARMQAAGADASLTGSNPSNTSKASQSAKVSASAHVRAVTLPSSGANAINRSSAFGASTAPSPAVTTPTVNSRASELRKRQQLSSSVDFITSAPTPSSSATPDCNGCEEDCDTGHGVSVVTVVVTTTVFATVTAAPTGTLSVTSAAFQSASSVIISSTASPSASAAASSADTTGFPTATTGFPVATSSGSSVAESIASTDFGSASSNPVLQASPTSVVSDASGSFTSIVVASPTSVVASFAPTPSVTPAPNNIILPTDSAAIASMITATVN
ncbi:unnamed protein product [Somion occarium]|uniref:Carbohydrate-binding module family 19 domain-containing protein n=1 Tax=Somion occarium TaxID=3059160 RepID=A0ABP1DM41_9APHY